MEQEIIKASVYSNCHFMADTADKAERGDTFAVLNQMLSIIQYDQWIKENFDSDKAVERKQANVKDLIEWLERLTEQEDSGLVEAQTNQLEKALNKILLLDILERNQEEEQSDRVTLMTYHSAKGLEFPHVFMVGTEEGLLPHQNSIDDDNVEEERRLAYVGITRAQKTCTLSYCTQRKRHGEVNSREPSRFLDELPAGDIEWSAKQTIDPILHKEKGMSTLKNLREILA